MVETFSRGRGFNWLQLVQAEHSRVQVEARGEFNSQDVGDMYGGQEPRRSDFEAFMGVPSNLLLAPC